MLFLRQAVPLSFPPKTRGQGETCCWNVVGRVRRFTFSRTPETAANERIGRVVEKGCEGESSKAVEKKARVDEERRW